MSQTFDTYTVKKFIQKFVKKIIIISRKEVSKQYYF